MSQWLPCDGSEFSPEEYPELAALLGDKYGPNRLPDMRQGGNLLHYIKAFSDGPWPAGVIVLKQRRPS